MEPENCLVFCFNTLGEFTYGDARGTMTFYTAPENFIGKHVIDVLPEKIALLTLSAVYKCFLTGEQQDYDYRLGGTMYRAKMNQANGVVKAVIIYA